MKKFLTLSILAGTVLMFGVCDPEGFEPKRVVFPVSVSGEDLIDSTNDLGWTTEITGFRIAVRDLEFTVEGEVHQAFWQGVSDFIIPEAFAHPGHYAGGEVTGELLGQFILDLKGEAPQFLGEATLLEGEYHGFNLYFSVATSDDVTSDDDPILDHTAIIEGTASKGDDQVVFTAIIDMPDETQMVGGVFNMNVEQDTEGMLVLKMLTIDPTEGDTLFDGIDFGELSSTGDGKVQILPNEANHNVLMKTLQIHDHYKMEVKS